MITMKGTCFLESNLQKWLEEKKNWLKTVMPKEKMICRSTSITAEKIFLLGSDAWRSHALFRLLLDSLKIMARRLHLLICPVGRMLRSLDRWWLQIALGGVLIRGDVRVIRWMQALDFFSEAFGSVTQEVHLSVISKPGVKWYLLPPERAEGRTHVQQDTNACFFIWSPVLLGC